jgi:hypothetical protein
MDADAFSGREVGLGNSPPQLTLLPAPRLNHSYKKKKIHCKVKDLEVVGSRGESACFRVQLKSVFETHVFTHFLNFRHETRTVNNSYVRPNFFRVQRSIEVDKTKRGGLVNFIKVVVQKNSKFPLVSRSIGVLIHLDQEGTYSVESCQSKLGRWKFPFCNPSIV